MPDSTSPACSVGCRSKTPGRDELHERLDRRLHGVAHVVDDRPAVAADRAWVAAGRHVEGEGEPRLLDEGPQRLVDRVVVLDVAPHLGPVDRRVAEAQPDEVVLRGPGHLGHRTIQISGGNRSERSRAPVVPTACAAVEVVGPPVPGAAHRVGEDRIGRRPAEESLVREDELDVDPVGSLIGQPLGDGASGGVAQDILGLHPRTPMTLFAGRFRSRRVRRLDHHRPVPLGDRPLRSVVAHLDVRDPREVLGFDVLGEVGARLVRVAVARHHEELVRVVGVSGSGP